MVAVTSGRPKVPFGDRAGPQDDRQPKTVVCDPSLYADRSYTQTRRWGSARTWPSNDLKLDIETKATDCASLLWSQRSQGAGLMGSPGDQAEVGGSVDG